jgi:hypothetical protein
LSKAIASVRVAKYFSALLHRSRKKVQPEKKEKKPVAQKRPMSSCGRPHDNCFFFV